MKPVKPRLKKCIHEREVSIMTKIKAKIKPKTAIKL